MKLQLRAPKIGGKNENHFHDSEENEITITANALTKGGKTTETTFSLHGNQRVEGKETFYKEK